MKRLYFCLIAVAVIVCISSLVGCQKDDNLQPDISESSMLIEPDALELSGPADGTEKSCTSVTDACGPNNYTNCVKYARCKQPALPYGLNTYQDKLNIINTQTAAVGRVAIINTGNNVGHVAYVQSVSGSNITIRETNWCSSTKVTTRTGTKAGLKIVGYFKP